jgi:mono/diheme cytochrome c family protein
MEVSMLPSSTLALLLLISLLPVSLGQKASGGPFQNPPARIPLDGAKIFQSHCAACHGADARGHGPAAAALKQSLHDLTLLSSRNGGKFPYPKVKEIIQGKQPTQAAHGSSEMPIWGPIFHQVEADQDWGEVRLDAVTKYLESLQQK